MDTIGMGTDCGVLIDTETDLLGTDSNLQLEIGDQIQCIEIREEEQEIDWSPGFWWNLFIRNLLKFYY